MKTRRSVVLSFVLTAAALLAASPAAGLSEVDRLWLVGSQAFDDQIYGLAERVLVRFIREYPDERRAPAAVLLLAKSRVALGTLDRALEDFRRARRFPTPPGVPGEAAFWEGEILYRLKRYPEAQAAYQAVLREAASPLAPDALYGLGLASLARNQLDPAVGSFRRLLSGWPAHGSAPAATYHLARSLADLHRPTEVRSVLADYETTYPNSPWLGEALYLRGWSQLTTGEYAAATEGLQSFLQRAPAHELAPQARLYLAEALLHRGKKADGLRQLHTLVQAPGTAPTLLYEGGLLAQRFDSPAESEQAWRELQTQFPTHPLAAQASLHLARAAFSHQRYADALAAATTATASPDPQVHLEARLLSGESLLQLRRYAEAQVAFEAVLGDPSSPLVPDALYGLGRAALHQNHLERAVDAFRQLLKGWPTHSSAAAATYQLARTLADLNRPVEAGSVLADYETAHPTSPWLGDALYLRGWSQLTTGQMEAATATLQSFLARAPTHELAPQAQLHLAEALLRQGNKTQGFRQLQTLLQARSASALLLYDAGLLAHRFDSPADAEQAWRQLQAQFPTHPLAAQASLQLARASFSHQRYADALAAAITATASPDPQVRLEARVLSGESLLQLRRDRAALEAFKTAVEESPEDHPLRFRAVAGLGLAHERLEHWAEAARFYQQVATSGDDVLKKWARERLASVKAQRDRSGSGKTRSPARERAPTAPPSARP
ncbi:MAG: tetratricopeptide repeat protein [Candidatus Rokubacteria bacterium]|nr:tetratricopeptide repeat protein [Candidatus Rokubacteria bacterium]